MSEEKCTPRQTAVCEEKVLKEATDKSQCEDIDICLPFGGRLYTDGGCLAYEPGEAPEDGTYGKIRVQNGCIVGVAEEDAELYNASPCAPVPVPCDCDGSGSGVTLSPQAGNLSSLDSQGRLLTVVHAEAGSGIEVSGNGTQQNPLVISATGGDSEDGGVAGIYGDAYIIPNRNTGNVTLSHKATGNGSMTKLGFTIDACGHITSYSAESFSGVTAVVGSNTVNAVTDNNTDVVTVSLQPLLDAPVGTTLHGGYNVTIDQYGRVTDIERAVSISNGTYTLGEYDVTLNSLGSVTKIVKNSSSGGDDDSSGTGLVSGGVLFEYTWLAGYYISVDFTLAKKSHVRVLFSPNNGNAPGGLIADIDGSVDLNRSMPYFGGVAVFSRTRIAAGSHTMHLRPYSVSGGSDSYGGTFEIQAFTLGTVDDGNNS